MPKFIKILHYNFHIFATSVCDVYIFLSTIPVFFNCYFEGTVTPKIISLEGHLWHSYLKQKSRNFGN